MACLPRFLFFIACVEALAMAGMINDDENDHMMDTGELEALYNVMEALLNDPDWKANHPRPCTDDPWPGLECEEEDDYYMHVTKLDIGSIPKCYCNGNASISPSIIKLPYLRNLFINDCFVEFEVRIPAGLEKLAQSLQVLSLRRNSKLVGGIPKELGNLKNLQILSLSQNSLGGRIPEQLGNLSSLQHLDLSYNMLVGSVPQDLGSLQSLTILDLSGNALNSSIPETFGNFSRLQKMDLSKNELSGTLPESFGELQSLIFLALSNNRLTGGIPSSLNRLVSLQYLIMENNPMFMTLPDFWDSLGNITELRLSNSSYLGPIPKSIGSLTNLNELALDRNFFNGSIPPNLGLLPSIYRLNLSNNLLQGTVPFSTEFLLKLGNNLNISGNNGLCVNDSLKILQSTFKRCDFTSALSSYASAASRNSLLLLFFCFVGFLLQEL